ncbi:hypothetical protein C0993_009524 [Termitomyces sp. T159_Od127]|nr:hypothetical protein C0993_009524 [Termitomyces sp. T159_Od127]
MDINELLNPTNEDKMYNNGTKEEIEEEIYRAVIEWHQAEEYRKKDDGNNEINTTKPSRKEALGTALTILQYVSDMDDPFACKLEAILASFGRQTRLDEFQSLRPTTINEYFTFQDV